MRLDGLRRQLALIIEDAGIENPWLEATVLVDHVLSLDRTAQILKADMEVDEAECKALLELAHRRAAHVPMAYITGHREFYGLDFIVSEDTLIPRPDSEVLVETALEKIEDGECVLDLCTGTGCIGISIASRRHLSHLTLVDISPAALDVARANVRRLLPDADVETVQGDLYAPLAGRRFKAIVSNPPYIRWDLRETLSEEVLKEPVLALHDADADALGIIRRIVAQAPAHLENPGFLAIECDYRQSMPLVQIMHKNGFHDISVRKDLAGLDRVVCGCWEGECTNS